VRISDSKIVLQPAAPSQPLLTLTNVNATIRNLSLEGEQFPLALTATVFNAVDIRANAEVALDVSDHTLTKISVDGLELALNQLALVGQFTVETRNPENPLAEINGTIKSSDFNLIEQLKSLQKAFPTLQMPKMASAQALTEINFNSNFNVNTADISTIATQLNLDNQPFTINTRIEHAKRSLILRVNGNNFAAANYLASDAAPSDQNSGLFAPLALPFALWLGQSQMELSLGQIEFDQFAVKNIYLNLFGNQKVLRLSSFNADLFGGHVNGTGRLDMRPAKPVFNLQTSVANIDLDQALPIIAESSEVSGVLSVEATLQGSGNDGDTIVQSLLGGGQLTVAAPSYSSLNAEETFCSAAALFSGGNEDKTWAKGTQLETLTSQFNLDKGNLLLSDLKTATGNIAIAAKGTVELLPKRFSLTANARVNGATTGPNGCPVNKKLQNRNLPFICSGSFDGSGKTSCKPDQKLINDLLKNTVLENLGKQLFKTPVTVDGKEEEPDPVKNLLKNIFEKNTK
jgi:AsmA protein